jgi:O-antigen polymerase
LLVRAATTPYMPLLHNQRFINYTLCVILYFIMKVMKELNNEKNKDDSFIPSFFHSFILNSLILTGLGQAIWGLLQLYGILPSFNSNFKITGTFFNPAPYALYLAVIFPMALGKVLSNEKINNERIKIIKGLQNEKIKDGSFLHSFIPSFFHSLIPSLNIPSFISSFFHSFIFSFSYYLSFATVIAILLVLPTTMIRAAWVGALAGTLVVLQYKYHYIQRIWQFLNNPVRRITAMVVTLAILVLGGWGLFHLKKDSANGKLFIWEVTLGKIAEKPLFGDGIGRFEAEYNNWQAEYFQKHPKEMDGPKGWVAGNTKYCFNEYLEMASEIGIVGLGLFLAIAVVVFLGMNKLKNINTRSDFFIPSLFHFSFLSILICAIFSFPFYSLTGQLLLIVIISIVSSTDMFSRLSIIFSIKYYTKFIIAVPLFICSYFLFINLRNYKAYQYWNNAYKLYQDGNYQDAEKNFIKAYLQLKNNDQFLVQYGKLLSMSHRYKESIVLLERAKKGWSDQVLYQTLGDSYKGLQLFKSAEQSYLLASFMIPSSIYSKYCLVLLYYETGDKESGKKWSEIILNIPVKVDSPAIKEIKKKILLYNHN